VLVSRSEVCTICSALHVRVVFPVRVADPCQLLPHVNSVTVSEYYELIRPPLVISVPTGCFGSPTCSPSVRNKAGLPSSCTFLSTHATPFVNPGRPSESSPIRFLCVGFWAVEPTAVCLDGDFHRRNNEAISGLREVRSSLWLTSFPVYASMMSFGR